MSGNYIAWFQDSVNNMRPTSKTSKLTWFKYLVPISMIVMGILDESKCPGQPLIPKWLIVMGLATIVDGLIDLYFLVKNRNIEVPIRLPLLIDVFNASIWIFAIIWHILGSIWVYAAGVSYDPSSPNYCNKVLYIYSIVMVSYPYVFIALLCIILPVIIIAARIYVWYNSRQNRNSQREPLV